MLVLVTVFYCKPEHCHPPLIKLVTDYSFLIYSLPQLFLFNGTSVIFIQNSQKCPRRIVISLLSSIYDSYFVLFHSHVNKKNINEVISHHDYYVKT